MTARVATALISRPLRLQTRPVWAGTVCAGTALVPCPPALLATPLLALLAMPRMVVPVAPYWLAQLATPRTYLWARVYRRQQWMIRPPVTLQHLSCYRSLSVRSTLQAWHEGSCSQASPPRKPLPDRCQCNFGRVTSLTIASRSCELGNDSFREPAINAIANVRGPGFLGACIERTHGRCCFLRMQSSEHHAAAACAMHLDAAAAYTPGLHLLYTSIVANLTNI